MQTSSNDAEISAKGLSDICADLVFSIVSFFSSLITDTDLCAFKVPADWNIKQVVGIRLFYRMAATLANYIERKYRSEKTIHLLPESLLLHRHSRHGP